MALGKLLTDWLDREPDMTASDDCTITEAPAAAGERAWDVIVLVVGLPDTHAIERFHELCERYPGARVIAVSLGATIPEYQAPLREAGMDVIVAAENVLGLPDRIRELVATPVS